MKKILAALIAALALSTLTAPPAQAATRCILTKAGIVCGIPAPTLPNATKAPSLPIPTVPPKAS